MAAPSPSKTPPRSVSCRTEHFTPQELVFSFDERHEGRASQVSKPAGEAVTRRVGEKIRRWLTGGRA